MKKIISLFIVGLLCVGLFAEAPANFTKSKLTGTWRTVTLGGHEYKLEQLFHEGFRDGAANKELKRDFEVRYIDPEVSEEYTSLTFIVSYYQSGYICGLQHRIEQLERGLSEEEIKAKLSYDPFNTFEKDE